MGRYGCELPLYRGFRNNLSPENLWHLGWARRARDKPDPSHLAGELTGRERWKPRGRKMQEQENFKQGMRGGGGGGVGLGQE